MPAQICRVELRKLEEERAGEPGLGRAGFPQGRRTHRPQTFSVLSVDETDTNLAGSPTEEIPSPGDSFASTSGLYKWNGSKRGTRIGHEALHCTFLRIAVSEQHFSADAHCAASEFLPAGTILIEAFVHFTEGPGHFVVPVTGGTGAYANARGFVRIRDLGNGESGRSNLEFHLLP